MYEFLCDCFRWSSVVWLCCKWEWMSKCSIFYVFEAVLADTSVDLKDEKREREPWHFFGRFVVSTKIANELNSTASRLSQQNFKPTLQYHGYGVISTKLQINSTVSQFLRKKYCMYVVRPVPTYVMELSQQNYKQALQHHSFLVIRTVRKKHVCDSMCTCVWVPLKNFGIWF
jgi:hypothetical protein